MAVLAADATFMGDGGGKVRATRNVVYGAERVARFLLGTARKWGGLVTHRIRVLNPEKRTRI